jgi:hypothetical protein
MNKQQEIKCLLELINKNKLSIKQQKFLFNGGF